MTLQVYTAPSGHFGQSAAQGYSRAVKQDPVKTHYASFQYHPMDRTIFLTSQVPASALSSISIEQKINALAAAEVLANEISGGNSFGFTLEQFLNYSQLSNPEKKREILEDRFKSWRTSYINTTGTQEIDTLKANQARISLKAQYNLENSLKPQFNALYRLVEDGNGFCSTPKLATALLLADGVTDLLPELLPEIDKNKLKASLVATVNFRKKDPQFANANRTGFDGLITGIEQETYDSLLDVAKRAQVQPEVIKQAIQKFHNQLNLSNLYQEMITERENPTRLAIQGSRLDTLL